jgi:hypothetical protein
MILDRYGGDKAELSSLCNILIDPVLHATKVTGIFFSKHTNDIVAAHKMGAKKNHPEGWFSKHTKGYYLDCFLILANNILAFLISSTIPM